MKHLVPILMALTILSACGKKSSGSSSGNIVQAENARAEAQELAGRYEAILRPINTSVSGWLPSGKLKANASGDSLEITTYLDDDDKVLHIQSIHAGNRCPEGRDDLNGDGLVDASEMLKVTGEVIVPLDGNLNSVPEGQDSYPMGKAFTYKRTAQVSKLLPDLYAQGKLAQNEPLNLEGRVVIIHGTGNIQRVPASVATLSGLARNLSIPITCGVIQRK